MGSSPINSTIKLNYFKIMINPTFWLFISFIILLMLSYKIIIKNIKNNLINYSQKIKEQITFSEKQKESAETLIQRLKENTLQVEKSCHRIQESTDVEIEALKEKAQRYINSYIKFKENYFKEQLDIYIRNNLKLLKNHLIEESIKLSYKYFHNEINVNYSLKKAFLII